MHACFECQCAPCPDCRCGCGAQRSGIQYVGASKKPCPVCRYGPIDRAGSSFVLRLPEDPCPDRRYHQDGPAGRRFVSQMPVVPCLKARYAVGGAERCVPCPGCRYGGRRVLADFVSRLPVLGRGRVSRAGVRVTPVISAISSPSVGHPAPLSGNNGSLAADRELRVGTVWGALRIDGSCALRFSVDEREAREVGMTHIAPRSLFDRHRKLITGLTKKWPASHFFCVRSLVRSVLSLLSLPTKAPGGQCQWRVPEDSLTHFHY